MLRTKYVALAILGASVATNSHSQTKTASELDDITVTSTRTERRISQTPSTVTRINRTHIEEQTPRDIKDLLSNEVGVSVRRSPNRFGAALGKTGRAGNEGINIRGIEGNRVLLLIDGIRLPNSFEFGSFATGRGDFIEVNGMKSIEILRGPSSIQYGSDGMAGVVNFSTLSPSDIYKEQTSGGLLRTMYHSIDKSWQASGAWAGHNDRYEGMIFTSYRKGHESSNQGTRDAQNSTRTTPNPLDYDTTYALIKGGVQVDSDQRFLLTMELQDHHQTIPNVYTAVAPSPLRRGQATFLKADDQAKRDRISLEHSYKNIDSILLDQVTTQWYWQQAKVNQFSYEERFNHTSRIRDNEYTQRIFGLSSLFEKRWEGVSRHRLSYGIDASASSFTGTRSGTVPGPNETFPIAVFPDTDYYLAGAFIQDEIDINQFSIIPGLRLDYYRLTPRDTETYQGASPARLSDHAWTPRIAVTWRARPEVAPYAQWAKGYRAPTPDQVNNGFSNPASGYKTISNPNLKPEHVTSWELGIKGKIDTISYALAYFDNKYSDFISLQRLSGSMTPMDPAIYQYTNYTNADIHGFESRVQWQMTPHWKSSFALAYAKGNTSERGIERPLETINPMNINVGLRYDETTWGTHIDVNYQASKQRDRIPEQKPMLFASPSSTVVDLGMYWKPNQQMTINANINNVFDKKYWRWSDVRGVASNSGEIDAYTAAGRNVSVSLTYRF